MNGSFLEYSWQYAVVPALLQLGLTIAVASLQPSLLTPPHLSLLPNPLITPPLLHPFAPPVHRNVDYEHCTVLVGVLLMTLTVHAENVETARTGEDGVGGTGLKSLHGLCLRRGWGSWGICFGTPLYYLFFAAPHNFTPLI